jgi:hypothetical protein
MSHIESKFQVGLGWAVLGAEEGLKSRVWRGERYGSLWVLPSLINIMLPSKSEG